MVIGGSGGYLEGIWRDQHFCQCSFFRALPTYSDGILHIPVHVLVFREYPRIFPSRRSYPPDIPPCDSISIEVGPDESAEGAYQQTAPLLSRPLRRLVPLWRLQRHLLSRLINTLVISRELSFTHFGSAYRVPLQLQYRPAEWPRQ